NPPIGTIMLFLRACGASWVEFFKELDKIDFKLRHEKMIAQVYPPPTQRKIQRDATQHLFYVLRIPKHILSDACLIHY
ncbi:MAG: hypothetical protein OEW70_07505, partial [candidate division WOR-3 bacterium]|nr:hypothetical protein [candidate division WOR-3 bacterium]